MATEVPAAGQSDEELLRCVVRGDAQAFRALVDRHAERWHGLAHRLLGRRDLAEDVVQEVFLRLWQRPDAFRPLGARFTTWAHRVVVNRCLDRLRLAGPRSERIDDIEPVDPAPDALSRLIEAERERVLRAEITRLPDRQRAALALVYTSGLSDRQAASVMDVSLKAFEALLVRAKRTLREAVARESGGEQ